jgi:aspartate/methionine/tyrosine aminotransferase
MRRSGIREVLDLAVARPGVLRLEIGEPDFPTPPHIVEAAARAAADGYTKYTVNRGLPSVRKAICAKLAARNGIRADIEQIVITTGGGTALIETLLALVEPGEAILISDPAWPNYEMMAAAINAEALRYPLERSTNFEPELDALDALAGDPRAKVLPINSPANPTGAVWRRETIERVLEIARKHDLYLLSDEVYEEIVFEGEHVSPATLDEDGRVVTVFRASKTYAMTGWRLGYLVAPPALADLIAKVQEPVVSCATAIAQKAFEAALLGPQDCVAEMRNAYRLRRDATEQALSETGLFVTKPQGAFYIFARRLSSDERHVRSRPLAGAGARDRRCPWRDVRISSGRACPALARIGDGDPAARRCPTRRGGRRVAAHRKVTTRMAYELTTAATPAI